jgi:hypothetical protein
VPEVSNWNSQFLISVPSLLVAVALIYVDPKTSVTFTVLSSTDWNGLPISILSSPSFYTSLSSMKLTDSYSEQ